MAPTLVLVGLMSGQPQAHRLISGVAQVQTLPQGMMGRHRWVILLRFHPPVFFAQRKNRVRLLTSHPIFYALGQGAHAVANAAPWRMAG